MGPPRIVVTSWKRALPTFLGERTELFTLGTEYVEAVLAAGGLPLLGAHVDPDLAGEVLEGAGGLVVSGGGDVHPHSYGAEHDGRSHDVDLAADRFELALLDEARRRRLPTLCICRGMQLLNVAHGGTLVQDIAAPGTIHPPYGPPGEVLAGRHEVVIHPGSRLADVYGPGPRSVNTIHHQVVDVLGDGLEVTAHATDGTVEGLEPTDRRWPVWAVQWHPEKIFDQDRALFERFVQACADR
jgi:putative glutamine amidotransferase